MSRWGSKSGFICDHCGEYVWVYDTFNDFKGKCAKCRNMT